MSDRGKVDRAFFDDVLYPRLGADRADVALGPRHGVDFGVLSVDDRAVVVAADPLSVLPALGTERAGRFALEVVLADVAVSGIAPSHLAATLTPPPSMPDPQVAALWRAMAAHARDHGVGVVSVDVGRYPGPEASWIGGATAFGVGASADLVRPDGARPGDAVVVSTGPGAEVAGLFATLFGDRLDLPDDVLAVARERLDDVFCVRDALAAAAAGDVSAMHDVTEGGLAAALAEVAAGAGVRVDVDRAAVPVRPGVEAVCAALGLDPWRVTSAGSLVIAVAPGEAAAVVDALAARGTTAAVVGTVGEGAGAYADGERLEPPGVDPSWAAFAELAGGE